MLPRAMANAATPAKPNAGAYRRMCANGRLEGESSCRRTVAPQRSVADHGMGKAPLIEGVGVSGQRSRASVPIGRDVAAALVLS